jgi:aldose 1-epimerase
MSYEFLGRRVVLDPGSPLLSVNAGLPIHGLFATDRRWNTVERSSNRLVALLDFAAFADLLAAFPFPHRLRYTAVAPVCAPFGRCRLGRR